MSVQLLQSFAGFISFWNNKLPLFRWLVCQLRVKKGFDSGCQLFIILRSSCSHWTIFFLLIVMCDLYNHPILESRIWERFQSLKEFLIFLIALSFSYLVFAVLDHSRLQWYVIQVCSLIGCRWEETVSFHAHGCMKSTRWGIYLLQILTERRRLSQGGTIHLLTLI